MDNNNWQHRITIDRRIIDQHSPAYFIADIAANHDGDLGRAKELIYLAKEAGADAAKFQHFKAESIVSDSGFKELGTQKSHQSSWSKSVFDVYRGASLNLDWSAELKNTCEKAGITFMTSPYAFELVDHLDQYVPAYKIGSGDITWIELIEYIAAKGKPYIVATGASSMEDVDRAVKTGIKLNDQIAILQCNTNYTGSIENMAFVNLSVLNEYRRRYPGMILGLSDHTPGHATVLGAIALGAKIIEKHFTDDVKRVGPDHAFSMSPIAWREMVTRSRELEAAIGDGCKKIEENESETVVLQRRSIRLKRDISAGGLIKAEDVEMLRPCPKDAMPPYKLASMMTKRLLRSRKKGEYLREADFD